MQVAHEWRISHDEFLEWSKHSRDKAIWYLSYVREACQSCGTRAKDFDEERGGSLRAYVWDLDQCHGCRIKAQGEDHLAKANDSKKSDSPYPRGTFVILRRNPDAHDEDD